MLRIARGCLKLNVVTLPVALGVACPSDSSLVLAFDFLLFSSVTRPSSQRRSLHLRVPYCSLFRQERSTAAWLHPIGLGPT